VALFLQHSIERGPDPRAAQEGAMTDDRPLVVLDARPHGRDRIFTADALQRLHDRFEVVDLEDEPDEGRLDELLPDAFAVVGSPTCPRSGWHGPAGCGRSSTSRATSSPTSTTRGRSRRASGS
jgi:hypothetical protein